MNFNMSSNKNDDLQGEAPLRHHAEKQDEKGSWLKEFLDLIKTLVISFVVMVLLNLFVFNLSMVKGQSMQPTLHEQERLFVNKLVYHIGHPQRSDVVVLHDPSIGLDKKPLLVKRVVAVPGDTVEIRDRKLYVNGEPQNESYTDTAIEDGDMRPIQMGVDEYFVMGDNRHAGESKDSRIFGSVKKEDIIGRVEFVFWPIDQIQTL